MIKKFDRVSGENVWQLWVILLAEFVGTFLMVFEIIAPSALGLDEYSWYNTIFGSFFMKSIWVTGFILILIYALRKISVNLNPVVTLGEIAVGNTQWIQGVSMISTQFLAAILASWFALLLGRDAGINPGIWSHFEGDKLIQGDQTLDSVYPIFKTEWINGGNVYIDMLHGVNYASTKSFEFNTYEWKHGAQLMFIIVPFIIEAIFTFILITTIVYFPKITSAWRPLFICGVLTILVALGIHTNNIALNPARLMGPAIIAQGAGEANVLQFSWIFLFGELSAVCAIFFIENSKERKTGITKKTLERSVFELTKQNMYLMTKKNDVSPEDAYFDLTKDELLELVKKFNAYKYVDVSKERGIVEEQLLDFIVHKKDKKEKTAEARLKDFFKIDAFNYALFKTRKRKTKKKSVEQILDISGYLEKENNIDKNKNINKQKNKKENSKETEVLSNSISSSSDKEKE